MDAQSTTSPPQTVAPQAISLPALGDGPTRSNLLVGIQLDLFGQVQHPANLLALPEQALDFQTPGTSGQSGTNLLKSANLQLSLENRLRANLDANGSLESDLTWKRWDMASGPQICALRASTRRTEGNDFIGWRTPAASDGEGGVMKIIPGKAGRYKLRDQAPTVETVLTGWPTPDTVAIGDGTDFETQRLALLARRERTKAAVKAGKVLAGSGRSMSLQMAAQSVYLMESWGTPTAVAHKGAGPNGNYDKEAQKGNLKGQVRQVYQISGMTTTSPNAEPSTGLSNAGELNPAHCRWLMGYPTEWDVFADTETP